MRHRGRWKFRELLEFFIENNVITFGEIIVYGINEEGYYEKLHHCGLGTFTGIGYQHVLAECVVNSFEIFYNKDGLVCKFYLS